jgi:hypothetical protein
MDTIRPLPYIMASWSLTGLVGVHDAGGIDRQHCFLRTTRIELALW